MKNFRLFFLTLWCLLSALSFALDTKDRNLTDDQLLDRVQEQTLRYFTDGAEPLSGLARERFHVGIPDQDRNIVTSGGSGFGIMSLIAGMERGMIPRQTALDQLNRMLSFLEKADRFHGAFPHWWNGESGRVKAFTPKDNGGDLVETAFLVQGLICLNRYLIDGNEAEIDLSERADKLWRAVEWDWYTQNEQVLYWHWSPEHQWEMRMPIRGYNECLIAYILAASSPTHPIDPDVYHHGWAQEGQIVRSPTSSDDHPLQFNHQGTTTGGPLFWAHYSFLGLDPNGLKDKYGDYFAENRNHTLANRAYCIRNPNRYKGYGENCWGLTASYSTKGYFAHAAAIDRDKGVISPTAAVSSIVYTPRYSMDAIRYFYTDLNDRLWGEFGFYDAFSLTENWFPQQYLAIDQGPMVVMIENFRSGLLWRLFMSHPDIQKGLTRLAFQSPYLCPQKR